MLLSELARRLDATLEGEDVEVHGLAPLDEAGEGEVSFVANPKYRPLLRSTGAAAIIVGVDEEALGRTVLRARSPYGAFVAALAIFDRRRAASPGVHPTAVVAASAEVGPGASVGPYSVIGEGARIGAGAVLHAHVVIYADVEIGDRFTAHAGAVVRENVRIGDDVVLQPGVVVGGDGFGYLPIGDARPVPIPQIGTVELGDAVEIGANSTVDRAAVGVTRIEAGVKIDNLVMVAHGCRIGENSMLAGQSGLAGSTVLGKRVQAGGQAGFGGHLRVGDDVRVAAQGGVVADVEAGRTVAGMPAVDISTWRRASLLFARLPELFRRLVRLEG